MAIYIRDMNMPMHCNECVFVEYNNGEALCSYTGIPILCNVGVQRGCPLTEVSEPHGRLIDADVLEKQCKPRGITDEVWEESNEYKRITNAKTIIERSETKEL